ncbi:MAG: hypothetical protein ACFBSG_13440 [Leptolyngbyaceae cyanobacterium]
MHQSAFNLSQILIEVGAVPGKDFSCDPVQQAYHLNDRCYELLQSAHPEIDWQDILGHPYKDVGKRIEALHQQLGEPFINNLLAQMSHRLTLLTDDQAAGYVRAILAGIESATGIALYPFLVETLNLSEQARLEWLLRQEVIAIPGEVCLIDLLEASGATSVDFEVQEGEVWLTETGWQRLALVWDSECLLSEPASATQSPQQT